MKKQQQCQYSFCSYLYSLQYTISRFKYQYTENKRMDVYVQHCIQYVIYCAYNYKWHSNPIKLDMHSIKIWKMCVLFNIFSFITFIHSIYFCCSWYLLVIPIIVQTFYTDNAINILFTSRFISYIASKGHGGDGRSTIICRCEKHCNSIVKYTNRCVRK